MKIKKQRAKEIHILSSIILVSGLAQLGDIHVFIHPSIQNYLLNVYYL